MVNRTDTEQADLVARLDALTERVETLEAAAAAGESPPQAPPPAETGDELFWALEGLKARHGVGALLYTGAVEVGGGRPVEWQLAADARELLDEDWAPFADGLVALGHPVRLSLLREVLRGTSTAAELGALEGMGTSGQVYHHLRQLVAAGWLRTVGRGHYEVPVQRVVPLLVVLFAARP